MRCNQCEAMMINGVFCHESGCPNQRSPRCQECGNEVAESEICCAESNPGAGQNRLIKAFAHGATRGRAGAMRIEGDILYSYAEPIARREETVRYEYFYIVKKGMMRGSATSSHHLNGARRILAEFGPITNVSAETDLTVRRNPDPEKYWERPGVEPPAETGWYPTEIERAPDGSVSTYWGYKSGPLQTFGRPPAPVSEENPCPSCGWSKSFTRNHKRYCADCGVPWGKKDFAIHEKEGRERLERRFAPVNDESEQNPTTLKTIVQSIKNELKSALRYIEREGDITRARIAYERAMAIRTSALTKKEWRTMYKQYPEIGMMEEAIEDAAGGWDALTWKFEQNPACFHNHETCEFQLYGRCLTCEVHARYGCDALPDAISRRLGAGPRRRNR